MKGYLFVCCALLSGALSAQTSDTTVSTAEEVARKELYEKQVARMKAFDRDPERFMDSIRKVKNDQKYEEALKRLASYQANQSIDTFRLIDLSNMKLLELPTFVLKAASVERLILDDNCINKLPRHIGKLAFLKKVSWDNNVTKGRIKLPKSTSIEQLSLDQNTLRRVPKVKRLKNLTDLSLSSNQIKDFPVKQLAKAKKLKEVEIKENPLSIGFAKYEKLIGVEVLKLNKCNIRSIDPSFYRLPALKELQLQENLFTNLPDGISALEQLSKISFYKCQLESVPVDFFELPSLLIADFYYNNLSTIPSSISSAQGMEVLFLSHNQIYDLPEEIGQLPNLQELYLHHNRLSFLPESLSMLTNMKVLRINNNLFQSFPDQILSLTQLKDLDLNDNLLTSIPEEISQLTKLKLFTFERNEINYTDQSNKKFMQAVAEMQKSGVVCKPDIDMNYLDQNGAVLETND